MDFKELNQSISNIHHVFSQQAKKTINIYVTLRNWLFGFYIQEYEQYGKDRAKYGDKLLEKLAKSLKQAQVPSSSSRSLWLYRQFYQCYPQILQTVSAELKKIPNTSTILKRIVQTASAESENKSLKSNASTDKLAIAADKLITSLSFSHFAELIKIEDPLKRVFYEIESIRNHWTIRELRRQLNSLYYERSSLSTNKDKLKEFIKKQTLPQSVDNYIRDPYIFEFLDLKPKEVLYENDLSYALLDKIQDFILELGKGFCFEGRNKRILIGDEFYFVDLVFYHRILKCHVLIELKLDAFNHYNIGQLNTYLNYYKKHEMHEDDNPPIGILLCTEKNRALVEYALADNQNKLFVSKYKLELPSKKTMREFLEKELNLELKDLVE